jgi:hypothetical protein
VDYLRVDRGSGLPAGPLSTLDHYHYFKQMLLITPPPTQTLMRSCKLSFKLKPEVISVTDYHDHKIHISLALALFVCPFSNKNTTRLLM